MSKPLIYVAHPFGGKLHLLEQAEEWVSELNRNFEALFFAPWIPQCRMWDNSGATLERGIALNVEAIRRSDAVILVGGRCSAGMKNEIRVAQDLNVQVLEYWVFVTAGELMWINEKVTELRESITELGA